MSAAARAKDPATEIQSPFPGFNIDKPLWDQSTISGRLKHFFWLTDPRTIITPTRKLYDARKLVENYRYMLNVFFI